MATTTFDPSEGISASQQEAEAASLAQGEKIVAAQEEDRQRRINQTNDDNEDVSLIGGKFKSQDELLKAYQELEKLRGSNTSEEGEEPSEETTEAPEEQPEVEEVSAAIETINRASAAYDEKGELSDETIEELSQMDSKELIKAYVEVFSKNQAAVKQQALDAQAEANIVGSVGGKEAYGEMVAWAASNLPQEEIDSYNSVTNSGNPAAIKFAVEALSNRYKSAEGYEAPLVTGKRATTKTKVFRSHAELSRAIADPRYKTDPAYRADVEQKLSRSTDLL